jgi:hypothetical protein
MKLSHTIILILVFSIIVGFDLGRASSQANESGIESLSQKTSLNETTENNAASAPKGSAENSNNNTLYLAISAIAGAMVTLLATHFNNKFRRYELEYNYRRKMERAYLSNAQRHSSDVYMPLYKGLIDFQNYWINASNPKNIQELKDKIDLLKQTKDDLEKNGTTAFLMPNVESNFNRLVEFLYNSLSSNEDSYGIILQYNMLGEKGSMFTKISKEKYQKTKISLQYFPLYLKMLRSVMPFGFIPFFPFSGLSDWRFEIILASAPSNTREFEAQLLESIDNLKNEIKEVTLGTK